jgi:rhodanese-related sulfurtransferase
VEALIVPVLITAVFAAAAGRFVGQASGTAARRPGPGARPPRRRLDPLPGRTAGAACCQVCGAAWTRAFMKRRHLFFCSPRCWFGYLKEIRRQANPSRARWSAEDGALVRQEIYPASYREITPLQAKRLLDSGQGYTYIDVRSTLEFDDGHPAGAVNIPLFHRQAGRLSPNPDFLRVVETHFPRDARLIVGCQLGVRSARAAEAMVAAGFTRVASVRGGFSGMRDLSGEVVAAGWLALGLPVEREAGKGQRYESLTGGRSPWLTRNT